MTTLIKTSSDIKTEQFIQLVNYNLQKIDKNLVLYRYEKEDARKRLRIKYVPLDKQIGMFYPQNVENVLTFNYKAFERVPDDIKRCLMELGFKVDKFKSRG